MAVFYLFQKPFLYMFGASDATIGYSLDYMSIYLLGTLFVELALGLNPFIISQGRSRIAMISIVIGAVVNIALDPLFIFVFGWGVKGAAIATVLSQAVSAAWNVNFLMGKNPPCVCLFVISGRISGLWDRFALWGFHLLSCVPRRA